MVGVGRRPLLVTAFIWVLCVLWIVAGLLLGRALPERGFLTFTTPDGTLYLMDARTWLVHQMPGGERLVRQPHVARDGSRIVYVTEHENRPWLAALSLPDGEETLLNANGTMVGDQTWHDGRLFYTTFRGNARQQLWVYNPDTGTDERFTDSQFDERLGRPSPDGSLVLVVSLRSSFRLAVLLITDGETERRVFAENVSVYSADWSPDGRMIVAQISERGRHDLHLLNLDTGVQQRLTETARHESLPVFSPDGRSIAFVSGVDGRSLYVMDLESGQERRITTPEFLAGFPSWGTTAGW